MPGSCPEGQYWAGLSCQSCAPNSHYNGQQCVTCKPGMTWSAADKMCLPPDGCVGGRVLPAGTPPPSTCPQTPPGSTPKGCPGGPMLPPGSTLKVVCPPPAAGCPGGPAQPAGASPPSYCPQRSGCPGGADCPVCGPNHYLAKDMGNRCSRCYAGSTSPAGSTSVAQCVPCSGNTLFDAASGSCKPCPNGTVLQRGSMGAPNKCVLANPCAAPATNPCPMEGGHQLSCVPDSTTPRRYRCECPAGSARNSHGLCEAKSPCTPANNCYLQSAPVSWAQAEQICKQNGKHLCGFAEICPNGVPTGGLRPPNSPYIGAKPRPLPLAGKLNWITSDQSASASPCAPVNSQLAQKPSTIEVQCCTTPGCVFPKVRGDGGSCIDCPEGALCGSGRVTGKCAPGEFTVKPGGVGYGQTCTPCPANTFLASPRSVGRPQDACTPCPLGSFSQPGSVKCTPCPAGTVGGPGNTCVQCPNGTFAGGPGLQKCFPQHRCLTGKNDCGANSTCLMQAAGDCCDHTALCAHPAYSGTWMCAGSPPGSVITAACRRQLASGNGLNDTRLMEFTCACKPGYTDVGGWGLKPEQRKHMMTGRECLPSCHPSERRNLKRVCECPAGTTLGADGSLPCRNCSAGFSSPAGATSPEQCFPCPANSYKPEAGAGVCRSCGQQHVMVSAPGSASCRVHPCRTADGAFSGVCGNDRRGRGNQLCAMTDVRTGNYSCSCKQFTTGVNGRNCTNQCQAADGCEDVGQNYVPWEWLKTRCPGGTMLCTASQICPKGNASLPPGRARVGVNMFAPVRDGKNQWVQIGDASGDVCTPRDDPSWGTLRYYNSLKGAGWPAVKNALTRYGRKDVLCCPTQDMCAVGLGKCPENSHCLPLGFEDYHCKCDAGFILAHGSTPSKRNPKCVVPPTIRHPNCKEENGCYTISWGRGYLSFSDSLKFCESKGKTLCSVGDVCGKNGIPKGGVRSGRFDGMLVPVYTNANPLTPNAYGMAWLQVGTVPYGSVTPQPHATCNLSWTVPSWYHTSQKLNVHDAPRERGEIQCCPKCNSRNRCFNAPGGGRVTWAAGYELCASKDMALGTARQLCSKYGRFYDGKPVGGARLGSMWVPASDAPNTWLQYGDVNGTCEPMASRDALGADGVGPAWGQSNSSRSDRGEVQCVASPNPQCKYSQDCLVTRNRPTWADAHKVCAARGQGLCPVEKLCPKTWITSSTSYRIPRGGIRRGRSAWAPVRDGSLPGRRNVWLQLGDKGGNLCRTHSEVYGNAPSWGLVGAQNTPTEVPCCAPACDSPSCSQHKTLTLADAPAICESRGQQVCDAQTLCTATKVPIGGVRSYDAITPFTHTAGSKSLLWMNVGNSAASPCQAFLDPELPKYAGAQKEMQCCPKRQPQCAAFEPHCHVMVDSKFTWSDARRFCQARNAHLYSGVDNSMSLPFAGKDMWMPVGQSAPNTWIQVGGNAATKGKTFGEVTGGGGSPWWGEVHTPAARSVVYCRPNQGCSDPERCAERDITTFDEAEAFCEGLQLDPANRAAGQTAMRLPNAAEVCPNGAVFTEDTTHKNKWESKKGDTKYSSDVAYTSSGVDPQTNRVIPKRPEQFVTRLDVGPVPLGGARQEDLWVPIRVPRAPGQAYKQWLRVGVSNAVANKHLLCTATTFKTNPNLAVPGRGLTQVMCVPGQRLVADWTRPSYCQAFPDKCSNGDPTPAEAAKGREIRKQELTRQREAAVAQKKFEQKAWEEGQKAKTRSRDEEKHKVRQAARDEVHRLNEQGEKSSLKYKLYSALNVPTDLM